MTLIFTFLALILSLIIILFSCEVFTNGVEWLGKNLNLNQGAVGSILAALGTALPETLLPVIAVFTASKHEVGHQIGVGAIIGAPLMLSTLAMFISGLAVVYFSRKKLRSPMISVDSAHMGRDFSFFIGIFFVAVGASFLPWFWMKLAVVAVLIALYLVYLAQTLAHPGEVGEDLSPLYMARNHEFPSIQRIALQIVLAVAGIIVGAKMFVSQVESLSAFFQISALILALVIAPIATELPEKFNSVIWMKAGKDTLALGNISGALVFQASIVPAMGILFTPWVLGKVEFFSIALTLAAAIIFYLAFRAQSRISPYLLIGVGGASYSIFLGGIIFFPRFFGLTL